MIPHSSSILSGLAKWLLLALLALAGVAALASPPAEEDRPADATLRALRDSDARVNAIFWRLVSANAPYCDPVMHATGLVLHARSSYSTGWREAAQQFFGFEGEVAVEAIDPDSPAAQSGLLPNDTLVAVSGVPLGAKTGVEGVAAAYAQLAHAGQAGSVTVSVLRQGRRLDYRVDTVPSCTQHFELVLSRNENAHSDGSIIQLNSSFLNLGFNDDELAAIIAHELGHVVLNHPDRLQAAGAYPRLGGLLGGKRRLIRFTEDEADRISPWLMYNAGFDPQAAITFWQAQPDSILNDSSHAQPSQRVKNIAAEILKIRQAGPPPLRPPFIDGRTLPLR